MTLDGLVIAGLAFSVTLFVISVAALVVITLRIQEDRRGSGCHGGGCRRRPAGQGCNRGRGVEGNAPGFISRED